MMRGRGVAFLNTAVRCGLIGFQRKIYQSLRKSRVEKVYLNIFESLTLLLHTGIPLLAALEWGTESFPKAAERLEAGRLKVQVENGQSLGSSLDENAPAWLRVMLEAAEHTGTLASVLEAWVTATRARARWISSMWRAVAYPCFLAVGSVVSSSVIIWVVVPKMAQMYSTFHAHLPWFSLLLLYLSSHPATVGAFTVACLFTFSLAVFIVGMSELPIVQKLREHLVPVQWFRLYRTQHFAFLLSLFLQSGTPLTVALDALGRASAPKWLSIVGQASLQNVYEGRPVSLCFAGKFSNMLRFQLQRAEVSGDLGQAFSDIELYARQQLNRQMEAAIRVIQPALTLATGGMVAFTMFSLYIPMYSMISGMTGPSF